MKSFELKALSASIFLLSAMSAAQGAETVSEALAEGKVYGDLRLRYESVEDDNAATDDATALTLRTKLGYNSGSVNGFSTTLEFEDSRIVAGEGDYTVGPAGYNPGEYSIIADPETTELDQAFVKYKSGSFVAKLGRQVITYDGHRFIGHVGWRQDRQTFDGLTMSYQPSEKLTLNYGYVEQRNRIFAEAEDLDSKDHFMNVAYDTAIGKVTAYAYMLELDIPAENGLDTVGVSLKGAKASGDTKFLYAAEYATQSAESAAGDADTSYMLLEGGVVAGGLTTKIGYEVLGSDDGTVGFATPLATLHKFNGWADLFIGTPGAGLVDLYASVGGSLAGGQWGLVYHEFSADEDTPTMSDYGSEIDVVYSRKFAKSYNAGIKYAAYSADDFGVDTNKLWVWMGVSF